MSRVRLPVRICDMLVPDQSRKRSHVFCPRFARSVDLSSCQRCELAESVSSAVVECSPRIDVPQARDGLLAGAAASEMFMCARSDVPARTLVAVVPLEPWALPIVDMQDRFIGFISRAALAASGLPSRLVMAMPAGELLFGSALAVPEGTPLRWAVHAMALRRTRVIALLDDRGALRGVLTDIDALHQIAGTSRN